MQLSVIIPAYNEADNLQPLYEHLIPVLQDMQVSFEIIVVNDGSTDHSRTVLEGLCRKDKALKVLHLKRNYGQTAALAAGFEWASGEVILTLDADLQNDPQDIPRLVDQIKAGFDVVCGWRQRRRDNLWTRRLPSFLANRLISAISGVRLHDYGCTLKAFSHAIVKQINLYGEMHRFLPIYAVWEGAKISEVPVAHHPRRHGRSKYGISRTFNVILDLLTAKFLLDFSTKPIYLFGRVGMIAIAVSLAIAAITLVQKYLYGAFVHRNPLIILAVMLFIVGIQFNLMGLLAELEIRSFHRIHGRKTYLIAQHQNFKEEEEVASG